jgi:iron(III) transport system permease protein
VTDPAATFPLRGALTPRRRPWAPQAPRLWAVSLVVVAAILSPILFVLLEAHYAGTNTVAHLIWRPLTRQLLTNTVVLMVTVTATCVVLGTTTAFLVERTDLPLRRLWAVLVVVPFAIPDFVVAFGWASLFTGVHGFRGAVLVMVLGVYPLVHLPVAAALRTADPGLEEAARSLGLNRIQTFVRVTLPQVEFAVVGGAVLVALILFAEYGAFEIVGYQTFTTAIYGELDNLGGLPAACALSLVLIALCATVLGIEAGLRRRGRGRAARVGALTARAPQRRRLGWWAVPATAFLAALVGLALGVPIASCVYWTLEGPRDLPGVVSLWFAGWHTAYYGALAGALTTALALPVAVLAVRHDSLAARALERVSYLALAVPGVVIGLALSYFSLNYADGFAFGTTGMLVGAYAMLFFPLALVAIKATLAHAPRGLDEAARSLGATKLSTFTRVTLPLIGPGLLASFCLVFLACITELIATLLLLPLGSQTLATQFWSAQSDLANGQAAPFALVMIAVAAVPSYALARFFSRRSQVAAA